MLRISLIIAIVAGLAAAVLNFYKVREVMLTTMNERDAERTAKEQALKDLSDTRQTLAKTEEELANTKTKLASTETALKTMTSNFVAKEKEAKELAANLERTRGERDDAQQKLEQWKLTGVTPDQVKKLIIDMKKAEEQRDILIDENKLITKKANELQRKLDEFLNPDRPVELPAGLKGRVVAVDPKFDFVVLDIGGDQGALERGEMLINRNGKLVGKIRIAAVKPTRCIANVLPEWKREDVMEGDQVLY